MADRYRVVGNSQFWNNIAYWSTTPTGGSNASVPGNTDIAYFTRPLTAVNWINLSTPSTALAFVVQNNNTTNYYGLNDGATGQAASYWGYPSGAYVQVDAGNLFSIIAEISGNTVLRKTGAGDIILAGNQTNINWTGGLQVEGGTVRLGFTTASKNMGSGKVTLWDQTRLWQQTNYTLSFSNQLEVVANASATISSGGTGALTWSGATTLIAGSTLNLDAAVAGAFTFSGAITGPASAAINKISANTATISGNNVNFTGTAMSTAGTLAIGASATALMNALFQPSTGALTWSAGAVIGGLTGSTNFALAANLIIGSDSHTTVTYSGALSGAGILTKNKSSRQIFSSASTNRTGATTIGGGIIELQNSVSLGTSTGGTTTTSAAGVGGQLYLNGSFGAAANSTAKTLSLSGNGPDGSGGLRSNGTTTYGGVITLSAGSTIQSDSGTLTLTSVVGSTQALTLKGAGNIALTALTGSGAITYSGSGTVTASTGTALANTGSWTVSSGTLKAGVLNAIGSASGLALTGTGAFDLNGTNQTINRLSGSGTVTSGIAGAVTLTATVASGTSTFSGVIQNGSGTVSFTKAGAGTQYFDSTTSTYTGATTVSVGTLDGIGTIPTATTVAASATIAAGKGAGAGDLTLSSTLAFSGAGNLTASKTGAGAVSKVAVGGTLTAGGTITVKGTGNGWASGVEYQVASYATSSIPTVTVGSWTDGTNLRIGNGTARVTDTGIYLTPATANQSVTWNGGQGGLGNWFNQQTNGWTWASGTDFYNSDTVTFSSNTTTAYLTSDVVVASLTMNSANHNINTNANYSLTNNGALTISGAFKQTINVAGNHGAISIGAGATLELGNVNALGSNTNPITLTGSAAELAFASGANGLSTARPLTLSPGGSVTSFLETAGGAIATISGAVTGGQSNAALTKVGSGTVSLTGTNSYLSFLRVGVNTAETEASNVLRVTPSALANTNLRLNAGSVLEIDGGSSPYTFSRTYGTGSTSFYTENLVAYAGGGFSSYGTGGLTISANITFGTSTTTQWVGPMYLGTAAGTSNSAITLSGLISLSADDGTFFVANGSGGAGSDSSTATISGVVSGTYGLFKFGPGKLKLTNTNTYSGATYIYNGTLETSVLSNASLASSIGTGSTITLSQLTNPKLRYIGSSTTTNRVIYLSNSCTLDASGTGALVFSGNFSVASGASTVTLDGSNTDDNRVGVLAGGGFLGFGILKTGTGTWLIDATVSSNWGSRTGTTTVSAGTLKARTHTTATLFPLGTGPVVLAGTLQVININTNPAISLSSIAVTSLTTSGGSARIIIGS
jgi:fibronectin-binding autotransporter adhesin